MPSSYTCKENLTRKGNKDINKTFTTQPLWICPKSIRGMKEFIAIMQRWVSKKMNTKGELKLKKAIEIYLSPAKLKTSAKRVSTNRVRMNPHLRVNSQILFKIKL